MKNEILRLAEKKNLAVSLLIRVIKALLLSKINYCIGNVILFTFAAAKTKVNPAILTTLTSMYFLIGEIIPLYVIMHIHRAIIRQEQSTNKT